MNNLRLDIGNESDYNELTLLLFINEVEFRKIILDNSNAAFFPELENSSRGSGDYLIFTCSCGVADCGGWDKVKVTHQNDTIEWIFQFNNFTYNFMFRKNNYEYEIHKLRNQLADLNIVLSPQFIDEPE